MSANLPQLYVMQFATNIQLLLQQKGSRFRHAVTVGNYIGKQASPVDQVGSVTMQPVVDRFAPIVRTDAAVDRRWVYPTDYDLAQMVDTFDKLRLLTDPQSVYVQNALAAAGRQIDDIIVDNMFAAAKTGEQGGTTTNFLAGQVVGVNTGGTASGLNVEKLKAARRILRANEALDDDGAMLFCAITAKQEENLLTEIEVINKDYGMSETPVLKEGSLIGGRYLGINFLHSERLDTGTDDQAGTSRAVPLWEKRGMHLGLWADVQTDITQRKDLKGLPWQAYVMLTAGATRIEEKRVVKIWAREA